MNSPIPDIENFIDAEIISGYVPPDIRTLSLAKTMYHLVHYLFA